MQELYRGVLLGVTPVRHQKKKQDWAEKLNCDAVATETSNDFMGKLRSRDGPSDLF